MPENRLLHALEEHGNVTPEGLRTLYRSLSVKLHPDVTGGSGDEFVLLQEEYAEAMDVLGRTTHRGRDRAPIRPASSAECREELLRHLYVYAEQFHSRDSAWLWSRIVGASGGYRPEVKDLLVDYQAALLKSYPAWRRDAATTYCHNIVIVMIKGLAACFLDMRGAGVHVLRSYPTALAGRLTAIDARRAAVLGRIAAWILEESRGIPIDMYPWPGEEHEAAR